MEHKRIYFFPKYSAMGPSSRYRIYSYLEYYKAQGYDVRVSPLFGDWYLKHKWAHKSMWKIAHRVAFAYVGRIFKTMFMRRGSIAYIGAEYLPGLPFLFERIFRFRKVPYIVEFDDAVFHNYDNSRLLKDKYSNFIGQAAHVITGCQYLSDYSRQYNERVTEIPTSVDFKAYELIDRTALSAVPVVGWIGSPLSSNYLSIVIPALKNLARTVEFKLNLIGFDKHKECLLEGLNYEIITWSSGTEVEEMSKFDVGIMPLNDSPFERGKCAFKLVQYMAVGIPTVSTPLSSNVNIDKGAGNLFASTSEEWECALRKILTRKEEFKNVGAKNREIATNAYTFQANWKKYVKVFESVFSLIK